MKSKTHTAHKNGFTALIAVILLSSGTLALSFSATGAVVFYADGVYRHETRVQRDLNERACLDTAGLMAARDSFVDGMVDIPEFGCTIRFVGGTASVVSIHFP